MRRLVVIVGPVVLLLVLAGFARMARPEAYARAAQAIGVRPPSSVTIRFVGDMSFDRYIRQVSERRGNDYVFSCMGDLLRASDLTVGNLEGPITAHESKSLGSIEGSPDNYVFTFPLSTGERLKRHGIDIVNIGNNHIGDFGRAGILSTQENLMRAEVAYFGGRSGDEPVHRQAVRGIDLSFVSYNQFGGQEPEAVAALVQAEKAAGQRVIVYTHWGEEYVEPTPRMRAAAALFAEAGADLVIGSHPHVVQEHEMIDKTLVYYSLGNFIFDQYFEPAVMRGQTVVARFTQEGVTATEEYVSLERDGRTCPLGVVSS